LPQPTLQETEPQHVLQLDDQPPQQPPPLPQYDVPPQAEPQQVLTAIGAGATGWE
jgi:hypothetical protein